MDKTHFPKLFKSPTRLAMVKMHSTFSSLLPLLRWSKRTLQSSASPLLVKTVPTNFYNPPARFTVVNTLSRARQASYTLCGGLNPLFEPLLASYTLFGGQNVLFEQLQTLYTLYWW